MNLRKKLYGGIDVHKSRSTIFLIDDQGMKVKARTVITHPDFFKDFFRKQLSDEFEIEVAVETGNLAFWICDILHHLEIKTYVVNVLENKAISRSAKKTDKRDARTLALQLLKGYLPERVYEPDWRERELRSLAQHRHQIVKDRTRAVNRAYSLLTRAGILLSKKNLADYERYWRDILDERIKDKESSLYSEFLLYCEQYRLLSGQLKEIEKKLGMKVKEYFPEEHALLLSIQGVGEATAAALLAYVGDLRRFKNARKFASYMGLVPFIRESGGKRNTSSGRITKKGVSLLRGYLTQGIVALLTKKSRAKSIRQPLVEFYEHIKIRKGWRKARIAMARKLCHIIFGVMKNREKFNPICKSKSGIKCC
jgi:transposase